MTNHLELEVLDFSEIEQLEESIAPVMMLLAAGTGGTCSGGKGSGCICVVPT